MKTHSLSKLSTSYETTIQILEQQIPAPTAQQCMDVIHKYTEWTTLTKETGEASSRADQCSRGGNCGRRRCGQGCRHRAGRGNGRKKHQSRHCKMDNHTTKACRRRKPTENVTNTGDTNTSNTEESTCYHCGLLGQFKTDCINFKRAWDQFNKVITGKLSVALATAGDRNLIWLAKNATPLIAASAPAAWVIDSGASHSMCKDLTRFNWIKKLCQPIVIELGDNIKLTVNHHGLGSVSQEYEVNAPYTPTFWLSHCPWMNWTQPDTHPHLDAASAPYHLHESQSQAIGSTISISYRQQLDWLRQLRLPSPP